MSGIRRLLARVARRLAADPRVRGKAQEVFEKEVKPRAEVAWKQMEPKLRDAGSRLQEKAAKAATRENVEKLAAKVKQRVKDARKGR